MLKKKKIAVGSKRPAPKNVEAKSKTVKGRYGSKPSVSSCSKPKPVTKPKANPRVAKKKAIIESDSESADDKISELEDLSDSDEESFEANDSDDSFDDIISKKPKAVKAKSPLTSSQSSVSKTSRVKKVAKKKVVDIDSASEDDFSDSFRISESEEENSDDENDLFVPENRPQGNQVLRESPKAKVGASNKSNKPKSVEEIYQKKSQLEHILLRPDSYIGSVESASSRMWVWEITGEDDSEGHMVHRDISFVPGFYKIFDEILVNAADNKIRDPSMDVLKVNIDVENSLISVYNNGKGIPIQVHKKEGVYVPELIFGHLLTSSNYDDKEKKVVGGRNGYGAKLCNIFSKEFVVETADRNTGLKFKQVFRNNMSQKTEPKISKNTKNEEYTKITFKPDLEKFGMHEGIDKNTAALLKKRVIDMAGCTRSVKVYLNGTRIKIRNFKQYADLYITSKDNNAIVLGGQKPVVVHEVVNDRWEVVFTLSEGQFQQVSFVNSISTSKGGTHVNYIADQIASKLIDSIQKKNKAAPVKPFQIKNQMWLFINCLIENPSFDSQTKENMTLKVSAFGSKCSLSDDYVNKIKKSGLVENVLHWAKSKQDMLLKKTDGTKKTRISGITKLDDANMAGTKKGSKCTLILTEGDSAKTLAVAGLGVIGRDYYGVFPLRGKLLNVREASHKAIMDNAEINNVKKIMGLQHGKKYTDTSSLRYGHIMIMTDQDHDGSHIKGLIINFLDHFWPELLQIPGFLCEFITPIVKVSKGEGSRKTEIPFYTMPEYETWKEDNENGKGWKIKYYKGLGTSTKEDAKKYFSNIQDHKKIFGELETDERELIEMAFSKKKADHRKEWLRKFQAGTFIDHNVDHIKVGDFINQELILFSMADNIRSLPSSVDGLKPGLRKILFACFKRNLVKGEIKVAQLAGYVAEHSAYHHGEQSLQSSIVGLAQNFVGSNNINLLEPRGQFGSRLQGGKDAASARYIFTRLAILARKIYRKEDDDLLNYLHDDGQKIEPEWYMPILPMILVNGGEGIGTGWSSSIPNFNPEEIVENLKKLMRGEEIQKMHPWYRGFTGSIEQAGSDKYSIKGIIDKKSNTTLEIRELPVRTWTQTYKEYLESLLTGTEKTQPFIKDYKEYHTDTSVHFVVTLTEANMAKAEAEGLEKKFKINTSVSTGNMVCFDSSSRIKKYNSAEDLLQDFFLLRLSFYQKRKEYMADTLTADLEKLNNKVRFINGIVSGNLVVQNKKKVEIIKTLRENDFKPIFKAKSAIHAGDVDAINTEDDESNTDNHGYDYLLSLPIWSLTAEKVEKLVDERDKKREELDDLLSTTPKKLWLRDLDEFMEAWRDFVLIN